MMHLISDPLITQPKWCMCYSLTRCFHGYCSRCGAHTTRNEHTDIQDARTHEFTPANERCTALLENT
jgi:hypothetical protein